MNRVYKLICMIWYYLLIIHRVYKAHPGEFAGYTTSVVGNLSIEWINNIAPSQAPFAVCWICF